MKRLVLPAGVLAISAIPFAGAYAHAALRHATPAPGATVKAPIAEIDLEFSESVEAAFSRVDVASAGGRASAPGKLEGQGRGLVLKLATPLPAGAYVVRWRAVSTDTHRTAGSYKFTVSP